MVFEDVSDDIEILPDDENFDGTHLERTKSVLHSETILVRVLRYFVKILSYIAIRDL